MKGTEDGAGDFAPAPFVVHRVGDRYSVCTAVAILCHNASYAAAAALIEAAGADPSILDSPADPIVFRSTWATAVSASLDELTAAIEALPQSADVDAVRSKQTIIEENLAALSASVAAEQRRREIEAGEVELRRRAEATFAQTGGRDNPVIVATVWASLRNSALGRRIQELRQR